MEITESQVQDRRNLLALAYEQHMRDASACKGAMEDCDHWLSVKKDESEATSQKKNDEGLDTSDLTSRPEKGGNK